MKRRTSTVFQRARASVRNERQRRAKREDSLVRQIMQERGSESAYEAKMRLIESELWPIGIARCLSEPI